MPGNVVSIENAKKHLAPGEIRARREAEKKLTRKKVNLKPPKNISEEALIYWKTTVKRMRGISLLDDVDAEMLAIYCQQLATRDELYDSMSAKVLKDDTMKLIQAQERLIIQYADKLGLTPNGRARLAKKRAEERPVDENADLFGD